MPFQGQKRNFVRKFKETIKDFPTDAIYVDLFGGSGLLSHTVKNVHPNATVVYNDFDDYCKRLRNVDITNNLISDLKNIVSGIPSKTRIVGSVKDEILERIKNENGFVDYVTISTQLLFSGKYVNNFDDLCKQTFYQRVTGTEYSTDGYLDGIEVVSMDYDALYNMYKDFKNVVFLLDPPYLSTDVKTYTDDKYWTLTDYLNVLKIIENRSFFYFTSNKSQIVELTNWLVDNNYGYSPFANATTTTTTTNNRVNYTSGYEDIMIYKNI